MKTSTLFANHVMCFSSINRIIKYIYIYIYIYIYMYIYIYTYMFDCQLKKFNKVLVADSNLKLLCVHAPISQCLVYCFSST